MRIGDIVSEKSDRVRLCRIQSLKSERKRRAAQAEEFGVKLEGEESAGSA
ncbi:MAG: hypothetical protein GF344_19645 [Chitinivibrionales bacterium]|nr:hypothetical protein [Chitinivibrionales bacterium]MBD3358836.1 hypothetical protein [Chitinivibrionales bacterium]